MPLTNRGLTKRNPLTCPRDPIAALADPATSGLDVKISGAISDAGLASGDIGWPSAPGLRKQLAERGLIIVETVKYDRMLATLQLFGSTAAAVVKIVEG